ncbi:hypothetical protein CKO44_01160 [Rubrivivax gelatinosus]|uniref:hypothetical protein n=1 Tax=Rubrivivax gelatinosus TaxID=28068 RepID=UPI0019060254|nr:hypothetical protein [Rubrivivax gelatinosus]MBK1612080.1 hypothetical protein [Rubrivivax gelatinosus]
MDEYAKRLLEDLEADRRISERAAGVLAEFGALRRQHVTDAELVAALIAQHGSLEAALVAYKASRRVVVQMFNGITLHFGIEVAERRERRLGADAIDV